jgi:hypothetical protein
MYNKREIRKTERSSTKPNPWAKDRVVTPGAPKVDPNGYWDPANVGRIIEVPSPWISMKGVEEPLVGVGSDTGMAQYMTEGNEYIFSDDSSVIEYPAEQYMELTDDEIAQYKEGGYVVEELPIAQKGISISDPKQFAYRDKMYNDSLSEYYNGKKYALMSEKDKGPSGTATYNFKKTRHIPYSQMKNNLTSEKESFEYMDRNIPFSEAESRKMQIKGQDPFRDKRSTTKDLFYKDNKIKPEGFDVYYNNKNGSIIYSPTFKKPVQPVKFEGKKPIKNELTFDPYAHSKTKVIPTIIGIPPEKNTDPTKMYLSTNEYTGHDEKGNPIKTIEYVYEDVKLPIRKLDAFSNNTNLERAPQTFPVVDPQKTNTAFRYRDQWQHVYKPVEGDFETFGTKQATMPYGEKRGDNKWEYTKSTDLPESGHHVWMVGDKKYYSENEAKAAAEQWDKEHSYTFEEGGYIADETYYPPKHNPANSFAVNDPRSMGRGGYVDAQMVHFQDGGNMDPGNNALELHMFYDKDVFKKQDGGEIGYYTDQEIEDLRRQGYIVKEE